MKQSFNTLPPLQTSNYRRKNYVNVILVHNELIAKNKNLTKKNYSQLKLKKLFVFIYFLVLAVSISPPHTPTYTIGVIYVEIKQQPYTDPISSSK